MTQALQQINMYNDTVNQYPDSESYNLGAVCADGMNEYLNSEQGRAQGNNRGNRGSGRGNSRGNYSYRQPNTPRGRNRGNNNRGRQMGSRKATEERRRETGDSIIQLDDDVTYRKQKRNAWRSPNKSKIKRNSKPAQAHSEEDYDDLDVTEYY